MALTRKFLTALGIEADKVDEIIEAHAETVNGLKAERDEFKANAEKLGAVQKELEEAKAEIENAGKDAFKVKYEALKEEYNAYKAEEEAKAVLSNKDKAYRTMLKEAGVSEKRIDAIMKVTNLEDVELDGDKLKNAEELKKSATEEWADFIVSSEKEGAGTSTPPSNEGGNNPVTPIPLIF